MDEGTFTVLVIYFIAFASTIYLTLNNLMQLATSCIRWSKNPDMEFAWYKPIIGITIIWTIMAVFTYSIRYL